LFSEAFAGLACKSPEQLVLWFYVHLLAVATAILKPYSFACHTDRTINRNKYSLLGICADAGPG
jgi:hypothetical protein